MTSNTFYGKQIFVSYSHRDKKFVNNLTLDLEDEKMRVWVDEKEILVGEPISKKVEEGIVKSDFFCLVISSNSTQSNWVDREYRTALHAQLTSGTKPVILPLLIEEVVLPELLRDIKYADFTRGYSIGLKQLLGTLKTDLYNKHSEPANAPPTLDVISQDVQFLKDFYAVIEKNLDDPDFSIDVLSNKLNIGRSTLFRKIQALTGETPNDFIQSYRLERGAQLLRDNYGDVTMVAMVVGFSSPQYFSSCFKKRFHQSPKAYQRFHLNRVDNDSYLKDNDEK